MSAIQLALIVLHVMLFVPRSQEQKTATPVSISVAFVITLVSRNINMHTLLSVLYVLLMSQVGRICVNVSNEISSFMIMFSVLMTFTVYALSGGDIVRRSLMQLTIEVKWVKQSNI